MPPRSDASLLAERNIRKAVRKLTASEVELMPDLLIIVIRRVDRIRDSKLM